MSFRLQEPEGIFWLLLHKENRDKIPIIVWVALKKEKNLLQLKLLKHQGMPELPNPGIKIKFYFLSAFPLQNCDVSMRREADKV